jgi:DNA-binding transcriptional MerR regulator
MDALLGIGVFARRSRLSLKALRLYDRVGLLRPALVGPDNGYRRYREGQLATARLIAALRRLDMPLAQVAEIVAAAGDDGDELLGAYWEAVERRVAAQRDLVALLRIGLRGGEARFRAFAIHEREVPEQLVLTEQRHLRVEEMAGFIQPTLGRLRRTAERLGGAAGSQFVVFHGEVNQDSDGPVEVCVPVERGSPDVATRVEPAHREAYVRLTRAQFEYPQVLSAYDAVEQWMDARRVACTGPPREIHLTNVEAAAVTDEVCDVAYPIP